MVCCLKWRIEVPEGLQEPTLPNLFLQEHNAAISLLQARLTDAYTALDQERARSLQRGAEAMQREAALTLSHKAELAQTAAGEAKAAEEKVAHLQAELSTQVAQLAKAYEEKVSQHEAQEGELQCLRDTHASELSAVTAGATALSKHVTALRAQVQQAEAQAEEAAHKAAAALTRAQEAEATLAAERAATQV
jgi:hypothetical protein